MRFVITAIALAALLLLAGGCNKDDQASSLLAPAAQEVEPLIRQYSDPDAPVENFSTFTVLPYNIAVDSSQPPQFGNDLLEKQMLFSIRNRIEAAGYMYVANIEEADLVFTLSGSNEYKTIDVPPSSITVPNYVPSRTIITNSSSHGNVSAYGTYGSAYGTYSGHGTATTTVPGYWTTRSYTRPGYTKWTVPSKTDTLLSCFGGGLELDRA